MKKIHYLFFVIFICIETYPQTINLGNGIYYNEDNDIILSIDTNFAELSLDRPCVTFLAYMGAKGNRNIVVHKDDVIMSYKGQEYKMLSSMEYLERFQAEKEYYDKYMKMGLGKERVIYSRMKEYKFQIGYDFFPSSKGTIATYEIKMKGNIGFKTKLCFKNPGFIKGEKILLIVRDKTDPTITGQVEVVL